ncbi:MAG: tetratricopeptide repeat protein [Ignavibacteria bacterium]|nr:tetratricopeptide repeat protein [Ignavibacteria bacterium]
MRSVALLFLFVLSIAGVSAQQPSEYLQRGNDAYQKQDFQRAIEQYTLAISGAPNMHEAYFNRGLCNLEMDSSMKALRDFDSVAKIKPDFYEVYRTRGYVYMRIRQLDKALLDMNKYIAHQPKEIDTYINRGHVKSELGDPDGAILDFDKAISLDSANADSYLARGVVRAKKGDEEGAYPDFKKAAELRPNDVVMLVNLGQASLSAGYPEEAGIAWRKYLKLEQGTERSGQIKQALIEMSLDSASAIEKVYTDSAKTVSIRLPGTWHDVRQDDGEVFNYFISKDTLQDTRAVYAIGVAVHMMRNVKSQMEVASTKPKDLVEYWTKQTDETTSQYDMHKVLATEPLTLGKWVGQMRTIELRIRPDYFVSKLYQAILAKDNQLLWITAECPEPLWNAYNSRFRKSIQLAKLP